MKICYSLIMVLVITPALLAQETSTNAVDSATNSPIVRTDPISSTGTVSETRSRFTRSSASTNSQAATNRSSVSVKPVDNLRLITSRNIFDQTRTPGRVRTPGNSAVRQTPRVESFGLVGTMLTSRGETAFFAGTSSSYQKSLKKGESIAGYKVDNITPKSVSLLGTNAPIEMKIGNYLRRENEGAWSLSAMPEPAAVTSSNSETSSSSPATTSSSAGSAELSDVMKAMMLRREKELSK